MKGHGVLHVLSEPAFCICRRLLAGLGRPFIVPVVVKETRQTVQRRGVMDVLLSAAVLKGGKSRLQTAPRVLFRPIR